MKVEKCANGHYYDSETFSSCPYCGLKLEPKPEENIEEPVEEAAEEIAAEPEDTPAEEPAQEGARVRCSACGFTVKKGAKFCRNCGAKIEHVEPEDGQAEAYKEAFEFSANESGVQAEPKADYAESEVLSSFKVTNNVATISPVVGWLVCVEGENYGRSFEIHRGDVINISGESYMLVPFGHDWN